MDQSDRSDHQIDAADRKALCQKRPADLAKLLGAGRVEVQHRQFPEHVGNGDKQTRSGFGW